MRRPLGRVAALCGAAAAAGAALCGPIDRLADDSFAWHMAQHLVLLFIVPLLLVLSHPFDWFIALAGKRAAAATVLGLRPLQSATRPAVALIAFVATLWTVHYSGLYEAALEHPPVHAFEHVIYAIAGTLFWLPVVAPAPLRAPSYPERLFYLMLALPQGALLGAALDTSHAPLYSHYATALGVANALADQHAAAAIVWIGGGLAILIALLVTLGVWAHRETLPYRRMGSPYSDSTYAARSRT